MDKGDTHDAADSSIIAAASNDTAAPTEEDMHSESASSASSSAQRQPLEKCRRRRRTKVRNVSRSARFVDALLLERVVVTMVRNDRYHHERCRFGCGRWWVRGRGRHGIVTATAHSHDRCGSTSGTVEWRTTSHTAVSTRRASNSHSGIVFVAPSASTVRPIPTVDRVANAHVV